MKKLLVRPRPLVGESFPGYILRLAMVNGWHSIPKFMSALGLPSQEKIRADKTVLLNAFIALTGHEKEITELNFLPYQDDIFKRERGRVFKSLNILHIQVCPQCLIDHPYHRAVWLYLPFTYCIEHQHILIRSCANCKNEFEWNSSIFGRGCSFCGYTWQSMLLKKKEVPDYLTGYINSVERKDYIFDLLLTAQRVIRPFDEIIDFRQRPPDTVFDWHPILEKAHKLLTCQNASSNWLSQCFNERKEVEILGVIAINSPIKRLLKNLKITSWQITKLDRTKITSGDNSDLQALMLSTLDSRLENNPSNNDQQFHTDIDGLDSVIGCDKYLSVSLSRSTTFNRLNSKRRANSSLYDLRELKDIITAIPTFISSSQMFPLHSFESIFKLFNADWGTVLVGIFIKRLNVEITTDLTETLMNRIRVSRFRMLLFLARNLRRQASVDSIISMQDICSTLVITKQEFKCLVLAEEKIFIPFMHKRPAGRYKQKDFMKFFDKYWSLQRWSKIHQINPDEVLALLNSYGIHGEISENIFIRSNKLKKALKEIRQKRSESRVVHIH